MQKIVITVNGIIFVAMVETGDQLPIVGPEIVKLAKLPSSKIIAPKLVMADRISVHHRQVVMALVRFIDRVQNHETAVVEGSLVHVILLGNDFGCKVGFIVDELRLQVLMKDAC